MTSRRRGCVARLCIGFASTAFVLALTAPVASAGDARPHGGTSALLVTTAVNSCPKADGAAHRAAPGTGKTVALTFDDGPGKSTWAILTILHSWGVKATFFNIGAQLAAHLPSLGREVRLGEKLGNHTWNHPDMTTLSRDEQAAEIDHTTSKMTWLVSVRPCVFRPPFGAYNQTTVNLATARQLGFWTWSVDPEDWKAAGSASSYWVNRIVSRARAGLTQRHPVILLHNAVGGNPATVAALPRIIYCYRHYGYRFVVL